MKLGVPPDRIGGDVQSMVDWFRNEGTPHDPNNPLNLQTRITGRSHTNTDDGDPPSDHIQAYDSPATFVDAFPIEMRNSDYPVIKRRLMAGEGLENNSTPELRRELRDYSGNGYSSIPRS
jgi:hypothetical protein